ncbi:MAG: hypothetical protein K6C97_12590 [Treponema sp.]|nr:hypothetical protein [Treponema sp.]
MIHGYIALGFLGFLVFAWFLRSSDKSTKFIVSTSAALMAVDVGSIAYYIHDDHGLPVLTFIVVLFMLNGLLLWGIFHHGLDLMNKEIEEKNETK